MGPGMRKYWDQMNTKIVTIGACAFLISVLSGNTGWINITAIILISSAVVYAVYCIAKEFGIKQQARPEPLDE